MQTFSMVHLSVDSPGLEYWNPLDNLRVIT